MIDHKQDGSMASKFMMQYTAAAEERCAAISAGFQREVNDQISADAIWISAPGRTEISGNHTDHQHGMVLAASIDRDVLVLAQPRPNEHIRIFSEGFGWITLELDRPFEPREEEKGKTEGIVRGVAAELLRRGYQIGGFEAYAQSQVLGGSGLSSSAAFETAVGEIFNHLYNGGAISPEEIAQIGCEAERNYFGKPCGLMDQMACSVGGLCFMDFDRPNHPVIERIPFQPEEAGYALCIVDTKGSHADLTDDYAAVPEEMRKVAAVLGQEVLRDLSLETLLAKADTIRQACGDRAFLRAYHFVCEEERVLHQKEALKAGDFDAFLKDFQGSANSSYRFLQNVYTNHHPEQQGISVALAVSEAVLGERGFARVHGGGFAGTIQAFLPQDLVETYIKAMDSIFGEDACQVYHIRPIGGMLVDL